MFNKTLTATRSNYYRQKTQKASQAKTERDFFIAQTFLILSIFGLMAYALLIN